MARSTWVLSDPLLLEHVEAMNEPVAKNWLFGLMDSLSHEQFTRLTVTLWAIWTARRKAIHEEIFQGPFSTNAFINLYLDELRQIKKSTSLGQEGRQTRPQARWIPPPDGLHKIMVDGRC
jgi:hypothetical protein